MVALINSHEVVAWSSCDWPGIMLARQIPVVRREDLTESRITFPPALPPIVADDEMEDAERWDGLS